MNPHDLTFCGKSNVWLTYTDYEFISPDNCTLVTITYDSDSDTWYGTVWESESADSTFEEGDDLPQDIVDVLKNRIQ